MCVLGYFDKFLPSNSHSNGAKRTLRFADRRQKTDIIIVLDRPSHEPITYSKQTPSYRYYLQNAIVGRSKLDTEIIN